jgi:hypothetical protein
MVRLDKEMVEEYVAIAPPLFQSQSPQSRARPGHRWSRGRLQLGKWSRLLPRPRSWAASGNLPRDVRPPAIGPGPQHRPPGGWGTVRAARSTEGDLPGAELLSQVGQIG